MYVKLELALGRAVAFVEALDATCGIDKFLLTSKERVACRADFHVDVAHGGSSLEGVATRTSNLGKFVGRVNVFFHNDIMATLQALYTPRAIKQMARQTKLLVD
jgi:hypothetical protein